MLMPGFTADYSFAERGVFHGRRNRDSVSSVVLQQYAGNPAARRSASISSGDGTCVDVHYLPVCRSTHPATPFKTCCDYTHERICNGQRVAICTFTECSSSFPDTNTLE
jgi:hypothetical protein